MTNLSSNPADAGTEQTSASELDGLADLYLGDEEEAQEANPPASEEGEKEDEPSEAEAQDEGEESETEESEEKDEPEDEDNATVEIDGKRYTLDEVKSGFMLQADYTRKTQALAAERNDFGAAVERLTQQDAYARRTIQIAAEVVNAIMPAQPDLSLLDTDPSAYLKAKEARERAELVLNELQASFDGIEKQSQQRGGEQTRRALERELEIMLQKMPELATKEGAAKFREKAIRYGEQIGLTESEIDSIRSHKELLVLKDAISFREIEASKAKALEKVKAAPKLAKPGARKNASTLNSIGRIRSRDDLLKYWAEES